MSAGFKYAGHVHWGTNGVIELYLEALCFVAVECLGADCRLAKALHEERDNFYMGAVIYLDDMLTGPSDREQFIKILDRSTEKLLQEKDFSDYGRKWVATEIGSLHDRLIAVEQTVVNSQEKN